MISHQLRYDSSLPVISEPFIHPSGVPSEGILKLQRTECAHTVSEGCMKTKRLHERTSSHTLQVLVDKCSCRWRCYNFITISEQFTQLQEED